MDVGVCNRAKAKLVFRTQLGELFRFCWARLRRPLSSVEVHGPRETHLCIAFIDVPVMFQRPADRLCCAI